MRLLPSVSSFAAECAHLRRRFYLLHSHKSLATYDNDFTLLPDCSKPPFLKHCIALLLSSRPSEHTTKKIHAFSIRHGVPLNDELMGKHLIFAAVCLGGLMPYAQQIFSQIPNPSIFTWNTMIRGYAESGIPGRSLHLYSQMYRNCVKSDTHTFPFLLKAIAKIVAITEGEKIHSITVRNGFNSLVFVMNTLVHMYAACGRAESAYQLFDKMSERDTVTWNTVINGYAFNGKPSEALTRFREMILDSVEPDGFTMVSLLTCCAELGALSLGRRAHMYLYKAGIDSNLHAGNALIDMYAKCGRIDDARQMFDELPERSIVSWTSLIVGLAINGFSREALELFHRFETQKLTPSEATFVGVLYACSHSGLVDEGFNYLKRMKTQYGLTPRIEHYGCLVDSLGRAGRVNEAYRFILDMPLPATAIVWRTLLASCSMHRQLALAELVTGEILRLDQKHSGDYVLLSNLYASKKRWSDVHYVRETMLSEGVRKTPGLSFVELGNRVYEFCMGDRSHLQTREIYAMLDDITRRLKIEGYVPQTGDVLADIEEEEKEDALHYHSERIAVAFVLINTTASTPIRVVKNLKICTDCHLVIKLTSKVFRREIVVRDRSRFHHFRDGSCSCNDYW